MKENQGLAQTMVISKYGISCLTPAIHKYTVLPPLPSKPLPVMSATNEIPVLTIPVPTSTTGLSVIPLTNENHSATLLHSPASSSAKSFTTACTSTEGQNHVNTRYPLSLPPPQSLRKSLSVDSFAKLGPQSSRSGRGYTVPGQNPLHNLACGDSPSRPEKHTSIRHRGESFSTLYVDQDSSPSESDIDRYDPLTISSTERFRHLSLKNPEIHKPLVRGGELPLPSRAQQNTNIITSFSSVRPPLASQSSFDSSKRGNSYSSLNASRSRSGSLGIYVANSLVRVATTVSEYPPRAYPYVLLIIFNSNLPLPQEDPLWSLSLAHQALENQLLSAQVFLDSAYWN
jgi:hypothetical protein